MAQEERDSNEIKRVNYFQGMMLVDQDFKDEQSYHLRMRHKHNLELHTWGVVRGLAVTLESGKVKVSEGLAIDAAGREIWYKGEPQPDTAPAGDNYLVIEYKEELRDKYPQIDDQHLRLIDTAKLSWKSAKADTDVVLARLSQGVLDDGFRRTARSVRANGNNIELRPVAKDGSLLLMTGGENRLTISPAGNVGIGTTDPGSSKLKIANTNADFVDVRFQEGGTGQLEIVGWGRGWNINAKPNGKHLYLNRDAGESSNILIGRSGKESFIRGSDGAVGIGTTDPGSSKLKIANTNADFVDVRFQESGTGQLEVVGWGQGWNINARTDGKHLYLNRDAGANSNVLIGRGGRELFVRGSDGFVGIGTTNPGYALQVGDPDTIGSAKLCLAGRGSTGNWRKWSLRTGDGSDAGNIHKLRIRDEFVNVDRFVIDQSGNVGIGTTDPGFSKLKIANTGIDFVDVRFQESGTGQLEVVGWGQGWNINARTDGKHLYLNRDAGASSNVLIGRGSKELFVRGSDGAVGIGTTNPGSSKLKIANTNADFVDVRFQESGTGQLEVVGWGQGWNINARTDGKHLYLNRDAGASSNVLIGRGGRELFVRGSDGFVGIGTNEPGGSLHIRHDLKAGVGPTLLIHNSGGSEGAEARIEMATYDFKNYSPNFRLQVIDDGKHGAHVSLNTKPSGKIENGLVSRLYIKADGKVGIGTTSPDGNLEIKGSAENAKVKFGGTGGDAHHLSSARDLVFNSATGNFAFRKVDSYGDLSQLTDLMTINPDGNLWVKKNISSPRWKVSHPIHTTGPMPVRGNFSTSGGTLLLFASGSAFKGSVGTIGMNIYIDDRLIEEFRKWTNVVGSHSTFISFPAVVSGIAAGEHKIEFKAYDCTTDSNDYYYATIMELPF